MSTIVGMVAGIVRTKILALFLGVAGVGVYSQFMNLISLLNFAIPLGMPMGVTKYVSEKSVHERHVVDEIYLRIFRILLIVSILFSVILLVFSKQITFLLVGDETYFIALWVIGFLIPFSVFSIFFDAYIKGLKALDIYMKVSIFSSLMSLALSFPLIYFFGINGAILGSLLNSFAYVLLAFRLLKKKKLVPNFRLNSELKKEILRGIFRIGIGSLVSGILLQLTLLLIRKMTIEYFGFEGNGIFQSLMNISINYFGIIFAIMSTYSFPKLAEMISDIDLVQEININFRFILLLIVPLVIAVISFRELILQILYTRDFLSAESLFKFQFLGDFFKVMSWILGLWLVARMKIKLWLLLDFLYYLSYVAVYYILVKTFQMDLTAASIAYLFINVNHFIFNFAVLRKSMDFKLEKRNSNAFIIGLALIIAVILSSIYASQIELIVAGISIIMWLFLATTKQERDKLVGALGRFRKW